jgi:HIRAN domain-containing protein
VPFPFAFEQRGYTAEAGSGELVEGRGYELRDERDRPIRWDDRRLASTGITVLKVAGTSYRAEVVQDEAFRPGSRLRLRPDPANEFDPHAVGVWDADGRIQVGFVPREAAGEIAERLDHESLEAWALWEWRDEGGRRVGLRMLIAPADALGELPPPV